MNELEQFTKMLDRAKIPYSQTQFFEDTKEIEKTEQHRATYEDGRDYGIVLIDTYKKIKVTTITVEQGYFGFVTEMVFNLENGELLRMGAYE